MLVKTCFQRDFELIKNYLLPPIRAAEIVECMCNYMDGISRNLQSLSSY